MFCDGVGPLGFNVPNILHARLLTEVRSPLSSLILIFSLESVADVMGIPIKSNMKSNDVSEIWREGRAE